MSRPPEFDPHRRDAGGGATRRAGALFLGCVVLGVLAAAPAAYPVLHPRVAIVFEHAGSSLADLRVIYAMHHAYHATHSHDDAQDMRNMGGLRHHLPWTWVLMWIATLAIAGVPPLSGFFSKDEILGAAFARGALVPSAQPGVRARGTWWRRSSRATASCEPAAGSAAITTG